MKHHVPITLDGPYPKRIRRSRVARIRRVVRARRTWAFALAAAALTVLWHFMG